jgi:hypothetical protein
MLASEAIGGTPLEDEISAKKKKEMRRQRRRIEELGEVAWTSARDRRAVRAALERFYVLEASGWKGRNGTALIDDAAVATFGRAMTRQLAADGRCQIDALEVDGHPIAMGVTIRSGRFAALWKIAYDENLAARSPGVQFILEYTRRQLADGGVDLTDSCAMPDHPMIDHIWRDRVAITDMFVPVAAASAVAFNAASGREAFRRVARAFAKRVYHEARARKRGPPPGRAA